MNKKIAVLTCAVVCSMGFVTSCGNDDEQDLQPAQEQPTPSSPEDEQPPLPTSGSAEGFTVADHILPSGDAGYFTDFHQTGETASLSIEKVDDTHFTLRYSSSAWGDATFTALEVTESDGRYVFPAGSKTTIVMTHGQYGGSGGGEYPLTLLEATADRQLKEFTFVVSAFMNERHGSYELTFTAGAPVAPVEGASTSVTTP